MPGNRQSIRLNNHDYRRNGSYCVTICTNDRKCMFGNVKNNKMVLNDTGKMVDFTWMDLTQHNENIELDKFIVMPNHIHGIINIVGAGSKPALKYNNVLLNNADNEKIIDCKRVGLEPTPTKHGLSEIVRQFKTFSAKRINQINKISGVRLWQRNYYEYIIRDEYDLNRTRKYIIKNPMNWNIDENNINNYSVKGQAGLEYHG